MYMTSEDELLAAARTAFAHTRPGGAAVFAPDYLRDTFEEKTDVHSGEDGALGLRCLQWSWDPDSSDDTFMSEYAFLLRSGVEMKAVHDRHVEGLFAKSTWIHLLSGVGYQVEVAERSLGDGEFDEMFLCRRPE